MKWRVVGAGQEQESSTELFEENVTDQDPCCVFEEQVNSSFHVD